MEGGAAAQTATYGTLRMRVAIRTAAMEDASALPQIEISAGRSFLAIADLACLESEEVPIETHQRYISLGTEWVAVNEDQDLVGFLAAEVFTQDLHLWELAVREDVQKRGVGRRLLDAAETYARDRHLESLTLTTFAHVPWNAPWYSRLGFQACCDDERLAALVRAETARGWPQRCAMRKRRIRNL